MSKSNILDFVWFIIVHRFTRYNELRGEEL